MSLVNTIVPNTTIKLTDVLGSGSFATIYGALETKTNQRYAIKVIDKDTISRPYQLENLNREVEILRKISKHDNIVTLHRVIATRRYHYIIMEECSLDLFEAILQKNGLPTNATKEVFKQVVDAVSFAHSKGIFHRDIKPENILISKDYKIRLADWGLSSYEKTSTDFEVGSLLYMSPECINDENTIEQFDCEKNDVWSLGVLLINLLFARNPWNEASYSDKLYRHYRKENPRYLREQFRLTPEADLLFKCVFDENVDNRCDLKRFADMVDGIDRFTIDEPISTTTTTTKYTVVVDGDDDDDEKEQVLHSSTPFSVSVC